MKRNVEYSLVGSNDIKDFSERMTQALNDGWDKLSPASAVPYGNKVYFYCEVVRNKDEEVPKPLSTVLYFNEKYSKMSAYTKDLLYINSIRLEGHADGKLYTVVDGESSEGISPIEIINIIKNSKHAPMDLDEEKVFLDIESLL